MCKGTPWILPYICCLWQKCFTCVCFQIEVFKRHFDDLVYNYGDQVLINLVSADGLYYIAIRIKTYVVLV